MSLVPRLILASKFPLHFLIARSTTDFMFCLA